MQIILSLLFFFKTLFIYFQKIRIHLVKIQTCFCVLKLKKNIGCQVKNDIKFAFILKKKHFNLLVNSFEFQTIIRIASINTLYFKQYLILIQLQLNF